MQFLFLNVARCIRYVKGTNLKANHNMANLVGYIAKGVSDMSKVQI